MPSSIDALESTMKYALSEATNRTVADPHAAAVETWHSVIVAMQSALAIFTLAERHAGEVEFDIRDQTVRAVATGPTLHSNAEIWLKAMWLAMICRDRRRINALAAVPTELLNASGAEYDDYVDAWVKAFQTYWRQDGELGQAVLHAMRATEPSVLRFAGEEAVLRLHYPAIELFFLLSVREDAQFNESLARALDLHKRYWTATEQRCRNLNGFVAWPLLAISCLAVDLGVQVSVESDYLPKYLLEGERVGEGVIG
ncbi:immunity 49 family protein [Pseudonocardia sp. TRM90224]|uniref:immunity 49 family protein n=1 Tax=Pseudonocardia sp. TRM90224 TaxID=2812678 RepID=UPI001E413547|nr:immunity 49 family protein [Pseudonocardia sp. TRM90224]